MIEEICGGGEGIGPEGGGGVRVKEKGAHAVGESADDALSATILLGRVWAR